VTWRDPFNDMNGRGKWKLGNGKITTTWLPSPTVEDWFLPLDPQKQTGKAHMADGTFALLATKT
jgi:hypothetical protein